MKTPQPKHYIGIAEAFLRADSTDYPTALQWLHKGHQQFGFDIVLKEKEVALLVKSAQYNQAILAIDEILNHFQRQEKWLFKKAEIHEKAGKIEAARINYKNTLTAIEQLPRRLQMTKRILVLEANTIQRIQGLSN